LRTEGGSERSVGWRWPTGACGDAVPADPGGGIVRFGDGRPWSCAAAAMLSKIEAGIAIVIARMGATLSRTDLVIAACSGFLRLRRHAI